MNGEDPPPIRTDPYLAPEAPPWTEATRTYVTPGLFRLLLGLSLVLIVMQFVSAILTDHMLPPALRDYAASDEGMPEGTLGWVVIGVGALAFLVCIASYVGMFMLRKWGRRCYVLSNVAGMAAAMLMPPTVVSTISETIDWVSWIAVGKIIAVAYFTPLFDQAEEQRIELHASRQPTV